MSLDTSPELTTHLGYDELGMHRHLLVSERLRARRRQLGLTQKEVVARLRRVGVTTTNKALSALEHGAGLDVCKLPELARALECTLTYLVGLTANPLRWEPDGLEWPPADVSGEAPTDAPPPTTLVVARATEPVRRSPERCVPLILGPVDGVRDGAAVTSGASAGSA